MSRSNRVVTTTSCPCPTTASPVTVSCPAFTTRIPTVTPTTVTTPTTAAVTPTVDLTSLLSQVTPTTAAAAALTPTAVSPFGPTQQIFTNPIDQLASLNPFAALAASNPTAALAAKSPALQIFNPAVNPAAAQLQFNPASAPTLALKGAGKPFFKPFGKFPFGKV